MSYTVTMRFKKNLTFDYIIHQTDFQNLEEMSIKNDACGLAFFHVNVLESTQSCDGRVVKAVLRLRITVTSIQSMPRSRVYTRSRVYILIPFAAIFADITRTDKSL